MYDEYLTVNETAEREKISTKTVYKYIKEGRLEAQKFGPRSYRISIDAIDALYRPFRPAGRR
jgi:excisionase family DNA binding protein